VPPLHFDPFDNPHDLRILLESDAAKVARRGRTHSGRWPMLLAGARYRATAECAAVGPLDEQFRMRLVHASGNRNIARAHRDTTERIRIVHRLDFTKPARAAAPDDDHGCILRAITRRRADEAQRRLHTHIEQSTLEVQHTRWIGSSAPGSEPDWGLATPLHFI
jgi:DNA-binding GntR family transcriptional regulator